MCKILSAKDGIGITVLPNKFIDCFMSDMSETELKVYIFLQRHFYSDSADISIKTIAEKLGYTERKIRNALKEIESFGLIGYTEKAGNEIESIVLYDVNSVEVGGSPDAEGGSSEETENNAGRDEAAEKYKTVKSFADAEIKELEIEARIDTEKLESVEKKERRTINRPKYSVQQLRGICSDENYKSLKDEVENIVFPKELKQEDIELLAFIYENLDFSDELIIHLYKYCADFGKVSASYIQTVAINWAEEGVKTVEEARYRSQCYSDFLRRIMRALGMEGKFPSAYDDSIRTWVNDYKMDEDVIIEAINKAVLNGSSAPFKYASKIIDEWHSRNITTLEGVRANDEKFADENGKAKETAAALKAARSRSRGAGAFSYTYTPMSEEESKKKKLEMLNRSIKKMEDSKNK